jgi:hypothetical protein
MTRRARILAVAMSAERLHDWTMALASGGIIGQESLTSDASTVRAARE